LRLARKQGGTRCPQRVDKQACGFAADIRAFGDSFCHRLQEKPIHLKFVRVQPLEHKKSVPAVLF
jgi:hypothetical protein